jgi:hypothetical protein
LTLLWSVPAVAVVATAVAVAVVAQRASSGLLRHRVVLTFLSLLALVEQAVAGVFKTVLPEAQARSWLAVRPLVPQVVAEQLLAQAEPQDQVVQMPDLPKVLLEDLVA